jgi:hypothetical protein
MHVRACVTLTLFVSACVIFMCVCVCAYVQCNYLTWNFIMIL